MDGVFKWIIVGSFIIGTIVAIPVIWLALIGNVKYEMQSYTAINENNALDIKIEAGTLRTEYYGGDRIYIEYPVAKGYTADIYERDGIFHFKNDFRAFFFLFVKPKVPDIVLRLPYGACYDLGLHISAGSVNLGDGKFQSADLHMSAGSLKCPGINCSALKLRISAGSASFGAACCNSLTVNMSAGSAKIESLSCRDTKVKVSAGSAKLGFTGRREEYSISKSVSAGSCDVSSQSGTTDKTIDISLSAGSVKLDFGV